MNTYFCFLNFKVILRNIHEICNNNFGLIMSLWRALLAVFLPPLAVVDKGCGSVLIVFVLTLAGWIPGIIAALVILNNPKYN